MHHLTWMNTRTISTCTLLGALASSANAQKPIPNIVHIFTDDFGWQDVACYYRQFHPDEPLYETPNLDRMAMRGMRFTQAYSPAPTCAPSRAAFITGQYGPHNGVLHVMGGLLPRPLSPDFRYIAPFYSCRVPLEVPTIPDALKKAGYITGHVKKMHVGGRSNGYPYPLDYGFDFAWGKDAQYNDPDVWKHGTYKNEQAYFNGLWLPQQPNRLCDFATDDPNDPYRTDPNDDDRPFDGTVDLAVRWMSKVKGQPFFLNYCTSMVHGPVGTRDKKRLEYYCKKLGIPFPTDTGSTNTEHSGQKNPYYAAMVDTTDWIVGKLITYLEETDDPRNPGHKLIDNTYVVFSSDNGGCTGIPAKNNAGKTEYEQITDNSPLRGGKQTPYEGGVRIPFMVRGPGIESGAVSDNMISLIDLFPTFMAMAGMQRPPEWNLDGCNILPVLLGQEKQARFENGSIRDTLFFHYPVEMPMASSIRKGDWKLYRNLGPGVNQNPDIELFRLYNDDGSLCDLGEQNNLVEANPEKKAELLSDLNTWLDQYRAAMPYKNPDCIKKDLPNQDKVPAVTGHGSDEDVVWVTVETGKDKARIVSAILLYTPNGNDRSYEEWFEAPAQVEGSRAFAHAPPGMTHGVLYLRDENNFLITSEPLPPVNQVGYGTRDAEYLKDGFAYKPGLFSMIKIGESSAQHAGKAGKDISALNAAIKAARATAALPVDATSYSIAIRILRKEIRAFKGVIPEADLAELNLFPVGKW